MKTAKTITFGDKARNKLLRGALRVAKAVSVTYGPAGKTVILERRSGNIATKDGVTVARELQFSDRGENLGALLIREPCLAMADTVGDGTTTAAVISAALLEECHKYITAGVSPVELSKGIREASEQAMAIVQSLAMEVQEEEEVRRVAMVSSNGDVEISDLLTRAIMAAGKDGTVSIEEGKGTETTLEIRDGMPLSSGFMSSACWPPEGLREHFDQPLIVLCDCPLYRFEDIRHIVETASQWPHPLLLIAHSVEGEALATWAANHSREGEPWEKWNLIRAPEWGHHRRAILDDIASLSGATVIDPSAGMSLQEIAPEWLGSVQTATVEKGSTLLVGYDDQATTERVQERIRTLQREADTSKHDYDLDRLQERIAKLSGGLSILRVGGVTEAALKERRARIEDALGSIKAALESGIVPGAGATYLFASDCLPTFFTGDYGLGFLALAKALQAPFRTLMQNAGWEPGPLLLSLERENAEFPDPWWGWDILQNRARLLYEDPMILDAARVATDVIRYAVSAVTTLITTEAMLVHK